MLDEGQGQWESKLRKNDGERYTRWELAQKEGGTDGCIHFIRDISDGETKGQSEAILANYELSNVRWAGQMMFDRLAVVFARDGEGKGDAGAIIWRCA
jgi:hypothetical protein